MEDLNTQNWKEFKVEDVFGKSKLGKYHNPRDLRKDDNGYYYICASNMNNGVNSQMPRVNGDNLVLTPSKIIAWGKQCPMFTYHDEQCVTSQGMYYIDMSDYDENVALFICTALTVACKGKYSYSHCLIGSVMDKVVIKLPVKDSGEIDFNYMQERVKELEQERVKELEQERVKELDAYLKVTGLNNYELTEEDKKVKTIHKINKTFEIGSLFEKVETKKVQGKANDFPEKESEEYCIPLLTAGIENHGFARYAKKEQCPETISNVISISANGANSGASFYQPYQFAVLQDAYAVKVKDYTIPNEEVGIYLSAVLNKSLKGTHGWTYKAGWNRVKYEKVSVPIKTDENGTPVIDPDHKWSADGYIPDWDYMQKITKIYEKEVIADAVKKKDEIIKKTKEIVNKD